MPLYLDYNATSPVHPEVLDIMVDVYRNGVGNASSRTHAFGQRAFQTVERAREQVASLLGVQKNEVVFTSGATESNNLAILGLARWGAENGRRHIISTQIEHKAVLEPLAYLAQNGFEVDLVGVDSSGRVKADDVLRRVRSDTLLVSVMHANNETGVIQPVHELGEALAQEDVFFHVDAAQTCGKLVPELRSLRYDLLSMSGHKMYGPQGIGALITRRKRYRRPPLKPLMFGGGQESGIRPGTVPVALVAGLGKAAEVAEREHAQWRSHNQALKKAVLSQLSCVAHTINGTQEASLDNCLNVSIAGVDSEGLMLALRNDLAVSNGSACTSTSHSPSHVLKAMGLSDDVITSAIRLSWGWNVAEVDLGSLVRYARELQ